ncbi:dihydrofolate reductase family protein [Glutamicibacter sp. NPDC087344]|uniref:dihydrofolate reductase family protein n=1 Tax=Glutamicibacter sp. NPDC087344 TaxID=3363994 RepID=UPI003812707F
MRSLTYYVAVSLDGYIAGPGGEFDGFLAQGDHMGAIAQQFRGTVPTIFADTIGVPSDGGPFDTVLMGWNTYAIGLPDHHLASPYAHLRQIVFTSRTQRPEGSQAVRFTDQDPVQVVRELKGEPGAGIWLCGGGALAAALADEIDSLVLKVNPVTFGSGIRLFGDRDYRLQPFRSTSVQAFESGVVMARYERG